MGQSCLDTLPASRATATSLSKLHACRRKTKLLGSAIFQTVGTADIYCAEVRSTNTQACLQACKPQAEDQLSQASRPVPCPPPFPFPCLRITRHRLQTAQLRIANLAAPQPVRLLLTPDFEGSHSRSLDFPRADGGSYSSANASSERQYPRRSFVRRGAAAWSPTGHSWPHVWPGCDQSPYIPSPPP